MKKFLLLFLSMFTLVIAEPARPDADNASVVRNLDFGMDLYQQFAGTPRNLFFSPFSITSALGMAASGAEGNTAVEMRKVLRFQDDATAAYRLLREQVQENAKQAGQSLQIANGLCLVEGDVSETYKTLLREEFGAEIFKGDLDKINAWVSGKTNGKIPKILEKVPANTVCILLNAIYFKGAWAEGFNPKATEEAPFSVTSDQTTPTMMMFRKGSYRWIDEKELQILELPYKGDAFSMVVYLPRAIDGLPELEKQLTPDAIRTWNDKLFKQHPREIEVHFPRFKLETEYDVVVPLQKLGMKDAFDPSNADFSGMGWPKGDLWIGQVKHKAFIEVNEEGTEAAAATAVIMMTRAVLIERHEFRADHPFFFVIRDNSTGSLLFSGRLVNPSKELRIGN